MKLKSTITLSALLLAIAGSCLARTWTSADGKNTFEGEFVSATETSVTVKYPNGRAITFATSKLSAEDQQFVKDSVAAALAAAEAKAKSEKLRNAAVPSAIDGKLVKLAGKSLKKMDELEVIPKYYFLAYSASWWGACVTSAPQLVEYYNKEIKGNSEVEMILMAGEDADTLKKWAVKEAMPWPMLKTSDYKRMAPLKALTPRGWPTYYLLDAEGKVLAKSVGSSAPVKAKIKELTPDKA